ncbi:unnamed protein product [Bursaphelenchus okinawaensis]|uniref:Ubiquitin-like domain-containing protein n=1 Tax=Bursaphelenchus okinawaensis TaxID=465554 RepID=A0A811JS13_9BILA|nr:unnamed protein product [Bursaphelenchus okinawaensis]CAG9080600.1 unnamed protein product [Bursaphelenchus okinawaensis]
MSSPSKDQNAHQVKEDRQRSKEDIDSCFDENKRTDPSLNVVQKLEEHTRTAKFESRFYKKRSLEESTEKEKPKPEKKMLLKPIFYDYNKHNPAKKDSKKSSGKSDEEGSAAELANLSTIGLVGSPTVTVSPKVTSSDTRKRKIASSPGGTASKRPSQTSLMALKKRPGPPAAKKLRLMAAARARSLSENAMNITIKSVMAGAEPLKVRVSKDATVAQLRRTVNQKMQGKSKFTLSYQGKELSPEDSSLSSHGVEEGAEIQIYVKSKTGSVDREEIAKLLSLGKTLSMFREIVNNMPSSTEDLEPKSSGRAEPKPTKQSLESENQKTKRKMEQLIEKMRGRREREESEHALTKKSNKVFGRRSDSDGADAGSVYSDVAETHAEATEMIGDRLTRKELSLYYDPMESTGIAQIRETILMDVATNKEDIRAVREEFATNRCALCYTKLKKLSLCAMKCRCNKVYCATHRNPDAHKCSVDLKEVDRQRLEATTKRAKSPPKKL